MISLRHVWFGYAGNTRATLGDINLQVEEAELVLATGRTGSGKSTLLGTMNGLVPHFTGGTLSGHVTIDGADTREHPPRELAHVIGYVGQDPSAGFVTDVVEEELAYGMEQLGVAPQVMRRRVEETLDLLGIAELRNRPLRTLSGGQQQRVAIGAVLTVHPKYLVLDEPTSALDPTAAEEVLATLSRLVHDLGTAVVLAEHRMERVIPFAERVLYLEDGTIMHDGPPADVLGNTQIAPPLIELGRMAEWEPLPVSTRAARTNGRNLYSRLETAATPARLPAEETEVLLSARDVSVRYGSKIAVAGCDLDLRAGNVLVIMGRNGSGKSSLLWALQGSGPRESGSVDIAGHDTARLAAARARSLVGLVPQTASDLLYLESVRDECAAADRESGAATGSCRQLLDGLVDGIPPDQHPRDLSEGQKLSLVLAVQLTAAPRVMLLDEPTRGVDYIAKAHLGSAVTQMAGQGKSVVLATHDVEFAAQVADRIIVMSQGGIISDGAARDVLTESPAFAPQVTKVLGGPWLTVSDVAEALEEVPS